MIRFSSILSFAFLIIISSCKFSKGVKKDLMTGLSASYNGFTLDDIYLTTEDGQRLKDNSIALGSNIKVIATGVDNFEVKDGKVFPSCTIILTDKNKKELLNIPDAFADLKEGATVSAARSLEAKLSTGNPMVAGETYHLYVRFFDKLNNKNEIVADVDLLMKAGLKSATNSDENNTVSDVKENKNTSPDTSETSAEKWVITSSGLKGATGTLSVELPADVTWNVYIATTADKKLLTTYNTKSHTLLPGQFNILLTSLPVNGVPIEKGMNTRLKAGVLNVVTTGSWGIWNESQTKHYSTYYSPTKLGLPVGKYAISVNGQFQTVEIKDGEVTEF